MPSVLFIASQPFFAYRGSPIRLGFDVLALAQSGYSVDFLTLPLGTPRDIEGVRILRVGNPLRIQSIPIGPSAGKLGFDALLLFKAMQLCRQHSYDVIHGVEDAGMVAWLTARRARAAFIYEKHSDPAGYRRKRGFHNAVMRAYGAVDRMMMRRADAIIGTGPGLVAQADAVAPGRACLVSDIPSSLADAAPEAVNEARARLATSPDDILATYVGSFAVYQGIDLLFEAMARSIPQEPRLRFVIVGGAPDQIRARRAWLAEKGYADNVSFTGLIDPDRLPATLAASDILLSPRLAGVNTPLKLLDYMKAQAAIVATDCTANRLILDDTLACLTPLTPDAFARGIVALARDPHRRRELTAHAAERLRAAYTFDHFRAALADCYRHALDRHHG